MVTGKLYRFMRIESIGVYARSCYSGKLLRRIYKDDIVLACKGYYKEVLSHYQYQQILCSDGQVGWIDLDRGQWSVIKT